MSQSEMEEDEDDLEELENIIDRLKRIQEDRHRFVRKWGKTNAIAMMAVAVSAVAEKRPELLDELKPGAEKQEQKDCVS